MKLTVNCSFLCLKVTQRPLSDLDCTYAMPLSDVWMITSFCLLIHQVKLVFKQVYFPCLMHNCWKVYFSTFQSSALVCFMCREWEINTCGGQSLGEVEWGEEKHFYWNVLKKTDILRNPGFCWVLETIVLLEAGPWRYKFWASWLLNRQLSCSCDGACAGRASSMLNL